MYDSREVIESLPEKRIAMHTQVRSLNRAAEAFAAIKPFCMRKRDWLSSSEIAGSEISISTSFSETLKQLELTRPEIQNERDALKLVHFMKYYIEVEQTHELERFDVAREIMEIVLKKVELRSELYIYLLKQRRQIPNSKYEQRVWELWLIAAASFAPASSYLSSVYDYLNEAMKDKNNFKEIATRASSLLKQITKFGARMAPLTSDDTRVLLMNERQQTKVQVLSGVEYSVDYEATTTVEEAIKTLAKNLNLVNYEAFSLYSVMEPVADLETVQLREEHKHLDNNKYLTDVLSLCEEGTNKKPWLLLKRRHFRKRDNAILNPLFVYLSYIQIQHDYINGNYPVSKDDALQLCALQIVVAKESMQEMSANAFEELVQRFTPQEILQSESKEEWYKALSLRCHIFAQLSTNAVQKQFLKIVGNRSYGNSVFFTVQTLEDNVGSFPARLSIGVNRKGLHFFKLDPRKLLRTAELKEILHIEAADSTLFLKAKIAGLLQVLTFYTCDAGEICACVHMHFADAIKEKTEKTRRKHEEQCHLNHVQLPATCLNEKYQQHVEQTKMKQYKYEAEINRLNATCEEVEHNVDHTFRQLLLVKDRLLMATKARGDLQLQQNDATRQITSFRRDLCDLKSELTKMGHTKHQEIAEVQGSANSMHAKELEIELKSLEDEKFVTSKQLAILEARLVESSQDMSKVEQQLKVLETSQKNELQDLRNELQRIKSTPLNQEHEKEKKISTLLERIKKTATMNQQTEADLARLKEEQSERAELLALRAKIRHQEQINVTTMEKQRQHIALLEKKYQEEQLNRKKYFNKVEDLKGKIRVYCRVRPLLPFERELGQEAVVSAPNDITISHPRTQKPKHREYTFDQIFTEEISQETVFESTKHLVQSAVDGTNVCVFAYGQTGSGKTFTIYGSAAHPGLVPRSVRQLFGILDRKSSQLTSTVKCYMLELYQNDLVDLLRPSKKQHASLEIKTEKDGMVAVHGTTVKTVRSAQELMDVLASGLRHRHVSSTKMNQESSRSHLIMSFVIETTNLQTQTVSRGKLSLIDLAGSERVKKSGAIGNQMKEAQTINKSLSALSDVISALAQGKAHVPYRNHKLTMLMSDSLGGTAKTLMFVNASPTDANLDETESSLKYAMRVKTIKNDLSKAQMAKESARLTEQIMKWKSRTDVAELLKDY